MGTAGDQANEWMGRTWGSEWRRQKERKSVRESVRAALHGGETGRVERAITGSVREELTANNNSQLTTQ
jgi:hypothetical protein